LVEGSRSCGGRKSPSPIHKTHAVQAVIDSRTRRPQQGEAVRETADKYRKNEWGEVEQRRNKEQRLQQTGFKADDLAKWGKKRFGAFRWGKKQLLSSSCG